MNGNHSADPGLAYRYAKGMPVVHPYNRTRVRINTPLDFLVVSDHAEFFGGIRDFYNDGIQDPDPGLIERLVHWYRENQIRDAIDAGDAHHYRPGEFTTLLGWEWSSIPGAQTSIAWSSPTQGTWQDTIGAGGLSAQWSDPSFQSDQSAFYYVRVLQIPTPRHALLDAIALGMDEPTEGPSIITERAYSSSIWYQP